MKFSKDSQMVKTWVRLVQSGARKREEVPKLGNLQEVVWEVLDNSPKN